MADYELVLCRPDGVGERYRITENGLRIGRGTENDVILSDKLASRRHARIFREGNALIIQDLDSRNGVDVNGARVMRAEMVEGDKIRIGDVVFQLIRSVGSNIGQSVIDEEKARALHESILSEGGGGRLAVLYQAAKLLGTVFDIDELLREILALIFAALPVRRGFIILCREAEEPEIHASRSLERGEQGPPLSRTLIHHVFTQKSAMLTTDAQDDSRFDQAASVFGHQIHSAMCAPLRGRQDLVGAIYVDSGTTPRPFTNDDLGLLTAIAQVVGVAVENARLYNENVQRERLAAIGQATAGLGHCVKNILTGIRGGSEFIDMAIREDNIKYLKSGWPIMSRSVDRIEMLVMNMLTFSRDRQPERSVTDIGMLIRDVFAGLQIRAEKVKVELDSSGLQAGRIDVDPQEIFRVIQNLTLNAIEACERRGGRVSATCVYDPEGCTFSITDTGEGIPAHIVPRLSQAFVTTKGSSGTGLGLACTYKIINEHGGSVSVDTAVGRGTTFTIQLPHVGTQGRVTAQGFL